MPNPVCFLGDNIHLSHLVYLRQVLVEHKANPDTKDVQGNTPLLMATKKMRVGAMGILLTAGAEVSKPPAGLP